MTDGQSEASEQIQTSSGKAIIDNLRRTEMLEDVIDLLDDYCDELASKRWTDQRLLDHIRSVASFFQTELDQMPSRL